MGLLECVPNFSEGRRREVIDRLVEAASRVSGARLLQHTSDADHNRTVLTLAGRLEPLSDAMERLFEVALAEIDLRRHAGVHPRIGAVDVVPFVPLEGSSMDDAVRTARGFGARVAERFDLPVLLYEQAARHEDRRNLAALRRGGLAGAARRLAEPGGEPDYGPARLHPSAGASAVGARDFLVAFNAVLDGGDLNVANVIAARIRESNGGLPALKAMGVPLESRSRTQVSMNLVDFRVTSPRQALAAVEREAAGLGVSVLETELIGLIPAAALADATPEELKLNGFHAGLVLENALEASGLPG